MDKFLFLCGQIRALESKMLSDSHIERMLAAKTSENAFSVLSELQYAKYFDEKTLAKDFTKILQKGLQETKELIVKGSDDDAVFDIIWLQFDVNNIKKTLKQCIFEKKEKIENFSEENGFSLLGEFTEDDLNLAIFKKDFENSVLPNHYTEVLKEIFAKKDITSREIEKLVDASYFKNILSTAKRRHSSFLKKLIIINIDSLNLRIFLRSLFLEENIMKDDFIENGTLDLDNLIKIKDFSEFLVFVKNTEFGIFFDNVKFTNNNEDNLIIFEKEISRFYTNFLKESQSGEIGSVQIPLNYFMTRLNNSRIIKQIMFSKMYNISPEETYKSIKILQNNV